MAEQLELNFDKKLSKKELLERIVLLETELTALRSKISILEASIWRNPSYNPLEPCQPAWPKYPPIVCKAGGGHVSNGGVAY